eukprot:CAMPEP_0198214052 /NCGR_PEP_ID=MMETSP1445-20131203/36861_1 /TAXON_ID=36898 /ORGANISM="Pyramimonas sp., Strain CCMP2087" /LENGTH=112 /DNA_ID=CAMNT_0043889011 /DNA_START=152 /DNA_END=490 /DNA_ORIENTATION=-
MRLYEKFVKEEVERKKKRAVYEAEFKQLEALQEAAKLPEKQKDKAIDGASVATPDQPKDNAVDAGSVTLDRPRIVSTQDTPDRLRKKPTPKRREGRTGESRTGSRTQKEESP